VSHFAGLLVVQGPKLLDASLLIIIRRPIRSKETKVIYKVPLLFQPQPEGGFTVTSPVLPEFVTEGDTIEEALANVEDALAAVLEIYHDLGRSLPSAVQVAEAAGPVWAETLFASP